MSDLIKILIPVLFSGAVLGVPQPINQGRAASNTMTACNVPTTTSSSVHTASEYLWTVPGVRGFTERSNFKFEGSSVPPGLQVNSYTVAENAPFTHAFITSKAYVFDSFLSLRVPGQQTQSPIKCGEVQTTFKDILYANVLTLALFSSVLGTCVGTFFYKDDTQEIDIEYFSDPTSFSKAAQALLYRCNIPTKLL